MNGWMNGWKDDDKRDDRKIIGREKMKEKG